MTTQDTRTAVEDAIKKAVPEIYGGLKPGGRVRRGVGWPVDTIVTLHVDFKKDRFQALLCREGMNITFDLKDLERSEVEGWLLVGRPITLEDVLRAIDKHTDRAIYLHCNGAIIEFGERGGVGVWEYGKPLSEQSDEVIEFLYSILCKV